MNLRVWFNFQTGKYDVVDVENDNVIASHDLHSDAVTERDKLVDQEDIS